MDVKTENCDAMTRKGTARSKGGRAGSNSGVDSGGTLVKGLQKAGIFTWPATRPTVEKAIGSRGEARSVRKRSLL